MSASTFDQIQLKSDEERAEMTKEMNRRAVRNVLIFVGVKVVIYYGLHRWAKSIANQD